MLTVQPMLLGAASVVRAWARIGTDGRQNIESYLTEAAATVFSHPEKRKRD